MDPLNPNWRYKRRKVPDYPPALSQGRTGLSRHAVTPLQFLLLFLPIELMNRIAQATKEYARRKRGDGLWNTSAEELYGLIGAMIYMGYTRLPQLEMYWSTEYSFPYLTTSFARDRLLELLQYVYAGPVDVPGGQVHAPDRLRPCRILIDELSKSFPKHFNPAQQLVIDESMVPCKARSGIKQYQPKKRHRWGYKVWCLASAGYLCRFEIYCGKDPASSPNGPLYDLVMRMTRPYFMQNHHLYLNGLFSSLILYTDLLAQQTRACGTIRINRGWFL